MNETDAAIDTTTAEEARTAAPAIELVYPSVERRRIMTVITKPITSVISPEDDEEDYTTPATPAHSGVPEDVVARYRAEIAAEFPSNTSRDRRQNEELLEEWLEGYRIRHRD